MVTQPVSCSAVAAFTVSFSPGGNAVEPIVECASLEIPYLTNSKDLKDGDVLEQHLPTLTQKPKTSPTPKKKTWWELKDGGEKGRAAKRLR